MFWGVLLQHGCFLGLGSGWNGSGHWVPYVTLTAELSACCPLQGLLWPQLQDLSPAKSRGAALGSTVGDLVAVCTTATWWGPSSALRAVGPGRCPEAWQSVVLSPEHVLILMEIQTCPVVFLLPELSSWHLLSWLLRG